MNAHKFIAEHGIDEAKRVLGSAPNFPIFGYCVLTGSYIFERKYANAYYHNETNSWSEDYALELIILKELKQVIASIYVIKDLLTLDRARKYAESEYTAPEVADRVLKAIEDYELVESYKPKSK